MPEIKAPTGLPIGGSQGTIIDPSMIDRKNLRADLLWGATKTGKGQQAWTGAYWMATKRKKKFLYLTCEPGSTPVSITMAVKAGLGDIYALMPSEDNFSAILSAILEGGFWPVYLKKNDGSITRSFKSVEARCRPDEYGMLIVDSLTSIGESFITWLADPSHENHLPMTPNRESFWVSDVDPVTDKEHAYGGSSGTHVYFVQQRLQELVTASANLPYEKMLWLSRETRGSKGEKKSRDKVTKQMEIIIQGEAMYGPALPGSGDIISRVTSWFGGAYHCERVIDSYIDDPNPPQPAAGGGIGGGLRGNLGKIPVWEYRMYLQPHPNPTTGLLYDAGNRFAAVVNSDPKIIKPYIVCTETYDKAAKVFKHTGLNTLYDMEDAYNVGQADDLRESLADMIAKFERK